MIIKIPFTNKYIIFKGGKLYIGDKSDKELEELFDELDAMNKLFDKYLKEFEKSKKNGNSK